MHRPRIMLVVATADAHDSGRTRQGVATDFPIRDSCHGGYDTAGRPYSSELMWTERVLERTRRPRCGQAIAAREALETGSLLPALGGRCEREVPQRGASRDLMRARLLRQNGSGVDLMPRIGSWRACSSAPVGGLDLQIEARPELLPGLGHERRLPQQPASQCCHIRGEVSSAEPCAALNACPSHGIPPARCPRCMPSTLCF